MNLFQYSNGTPIQYKDIYGLWPTFEHNIIIYTKFNGIAPGYIEAIQRGSSYADSLQFQDAYFSYMHSMRNKNQSAEKSCELKSEFINTHLSYYKLHLNAGRFENAYFELGMALHPIMDSTSPSHAGTQVWSNIDYSNLLDIPLQLIHISEHVMGEQFMSVNDLTFTTNVIDYWLK